MIISVRAYRVHWSLIIATVSKILDEGRLILCAGPGGVGKTTTAAALGLRAASTGKRVIVLTIDPAKRLADSLGLEALSNMPQRVQLPDDSGTGELWAMMLDQQQTLDDLVERNAPDAATVQRSRDNNIYKLLSSTLHGMQEYMALDKLHDLYTSGNYDLVVLDTPPTKNALEFLETPNRARQFFDDRVMKWFLPQKKSSFLRRLTKPSTIVLSLMGKTFGKTFVDDLVEFFDTLQFLQETLRTRGELIDFILREPTTHFVIITGADKRRIDEAIFFHEKLETLNQKASLFILNRVVPKFDSIDLDTLKTPKNLSKKSWETMQEKYVNLQKVSERSYRLIDELKKTVGENLVQVVPLLREDIHTLSQLGELGSRLD